MMSSFSSRVKVVGSAVELVAMDSDEMPRFLNGRAAVPVSPMAVFFEAAAAAFTSDVHVESFEMRVCDGPLGSGVLETLCSR